MPLTGKEKNDIAIGATLALGFRPGEFTQASLQRRDPIVSLAFGTQAADVVEVLTSRIRFPQLSPADIGRAALAGRAGSLVSQDPFFGDVVISQPDQTEFLTELVRNAAIRRAAAEQDTSRLFLQRRAVIERLAETAEDRGFARAVDPSLRGGVFRASAEAPLQFIEGDFLP